MRKALDNFYKHLSELNEQDFWIVLKVLTLGVIGGLAFTRRYISSYTEAQKKSFIIRHAEKFNCTYTKTKYNIRPVCPDTILYSQLEDAIYDHIDSLPYTKIYITCLLVTGLVGLLIGMNQVKKRHDSYWQDVEEQKKTANTSNIAQLEQEAKELEKKYGAQYRQAQARRLPHPHFLCEHNSNELIGLLMVVGSDGVCRGLELFKQMVASKSCNTFDGRPLLPYGIRDRRLQGNLLAYIENKPIPQIATISFKKISKLRLLYNLLPEIFLKLKGSALLMGGISIGLYLSVFFSTINRSPEEETFSINRLMKVFAYALPEIIGSLSLLILIKLPELSDWFNQKITKAKYEDIVDPEDVGVGHKLDDRLVDYITYEVLEDARICEDGNTYSYKAIRRFWERQPIKKSPIDPNFKFKNGYPLLFTYVQRQQEVDEKVKSERAVIAQQKLARR